MGINHTLRIARGARCVTKPGSGFFIEARPGEIAIGLSQPILISHGIAQPCFGQMRAIGQDDEAFDVFKLRRQLLDQGDEGQVQHQHARSGMVQDPGDLIREQPRIDRVVNGANAGDAIPGFHMAPGIPGECGNPIPQLDAIALQALGNTQRA